MAQVACLGECMIELREMADGRFSRGYGGDTLNTAVYLARLGVAVDYVTALGDDLWSDEMLAGWAAEGVGTGRVARLPGRVPGLYIIQTDARGERRFSYWRDSAPARALFDGSETAEIVAALPSYDLLYFSGITLSLYGDAGRARFVKVLDRRSGSGAPHRVRHQLPAARLARPRRRAGGLPDRVRPCEHRSRLNRGSRAAVRRRRRARDPVSPLIG